jgi:hypothetical protein
MLLFYVSAMLYFYHYIIVHTFSRLYSASSIPIHSVYTSLLIDHFLLCLIQSGVILFFVALGAIG